MGLIVQDFVSADGFAADANISLRLVVMPIAIGASRGVFPPGQGPDLLTLGGHVPNTAPEDASHCPQHKPRISRTAVSPQSVARP